MIRLFTVLLVVFIHSETSAQVPANIQRRCETILVDASDSGNQPDYLTIRRLRHVPLERIETRLRKALQAEVVSVRLVAADVFWLLAPSRFRDEIVQSIDEMEGQTPVETIRQAIMLMKMGDLKAKETIMAVTQLARKFC